MKKILLIIGIGIFLTSCDKKNLPEVGGTSAEKMANEWWIEVSYQGQALTPHLKLLTYNTAANGNEIWIDDTGTWPYKGKVSADFGALTFSSAKSANEYKADAAAKITNGKVIVNGGHSRSGNVTDSIYFEAEFADDPGTKYVYSGHARTRFAEDDY